MATVACGAALRRGRDGLRGNRVFGMSQDGGASLVPNPPRGGGDTHDVWIDPSNTSRLIVASDAGVSLSRDGGQTWMRHTVMHSLLFRPALG